MPPAEVTIRALPQAPIWVQALMFGLALEQPSDQVPITLTLLRC